MISTSSQDWFAWGHEGLDRIHRKSRRRMHNAVLGTAGSEDHSREANSGDLSSYTSVVHRWPRALVSLWDSTDQLATDARQRGYTCVLARHPGSESALPLITLKMNLKQA